MNKLRRIISIIYLSGMNLLTIVFGIIIPNMFYSTNYTSIDVSREQYLKWSEYNLINCYTNSIEDSYMKLFGKFAGANLYCAIDGVNEIADKEIINIKEINQPHNHNLYEIKYLTDNFKTNNMKELFLDGSIGIHSDNFEINNPNLKKIIFNSKRVLYGRVSTTISHNKLYFLDEECVLCDGKEFNLTVQDFEYLFPNVIVISRSGVIKYWADVDDSQLELLNWEYSNTCTTLYSNSDCTELFDLNTIINKEYKYNSNGDLIYVYHPFILYTKSDY